MYTKTCGVHVESSEVSEMESSWEVTVLMISKSEVSKMIYPNKKRRESGFEMSH
jgi:hypothetical protein